MSIRKVAEKRVPLPWVLLANAARARCLERDPENGALRELADFVHPDSRLKGAALGLDAGDLVRKGAVTTQYQPPTDPHDKAHRAFARELAQHLETAALEHRLVELALFASDPFLGELKAQLGKAGTAALRAALPLDLTSFAGAELEQRVSRALGGAT